MSEDDSSTFLGSNNRIVISTTDCSDTDIFLQLYLTRVSYTETDADGAPEVVVDPAEYADYERMGGTQYKNVGRGQYSPVYLDLPDDGT